MALLITQKCINCDMCLSECPNQAISYGGVLYQIDTDRCTECIGHYDDPACKAVCPINHAIISDPEYRETLTQLQQKFDKLYSETDS